MVAKSFQSMEQVTEPYEINGRMYVKIKNDKTGTLRQVRWYSEREYKALYPYEVVDPYGKSQKEALGFKAGFITIFSGNTYENKEWLKSIGAKYRKSWGWGLAGDIELPVGVPEDVTPIRLDWDKVGKDESLLNDDLVRKTIDELVYEPSLSKFQGAVGDRLTIDVTVDKAIRLNGIYGPSTMHIMTDGCGNAFVWTTGSRSWAEGSKHTIRGTVKDHRVYKNVKQTILTRCSDAAKK